MRVSSTEYESDGQSLEIFLRCLKIDFVMDIMCDWNERVESRMTPRLQTSGDGQTEQLSTSRRTSLFLGSHNHELCFVAI